MSQIRLSDVFDRQRRKSFFESIFNEVHDENQSLQRHKDYVPFERQVFKTFDDIYSRFGLGFFDNDLSPPHNSIDFQQDDNQYFLAIAAPGKSKDDFKVEIDDSNGRKLIHIFTEKTEEKEDDQSGYVSKFAKRSYSLRYGLPKNIDEDNVKASYKDGILNVEIPKKEINKRQKLISVT